MRITDLRLTFLLVSMSVCGPASMLGLAGCSSPIAAMPAAAPECPARGACWVRGRPMQVGGDRELGTVYAIGGEGAFLRWDADRWASAPVPTGRALVSAWVGSATNAWVSDAEGSAWHFDGAQWTETMADSAIERVMGAPDGRVWALAGGTATGHGGLSGTRLLRRDVDRWVQPMEPYAYCLGGDYLLVRGAAESEAWSAGLTCDAMGIVRALEVRRFDGAGWQLVGRPIPAQAWYPSLESLHGRVRVHALGSFEWDGAAWNRLVLPDFPQDLGIGEIAWADGLGYTRMPSTIGCDAAYRLDDANVWCFGEGQIDFLAGAVWTPTLADAFASESARDRWGTIPPTLWAGSDSRRAWGSSATDVYRVRDSTGARLEHFDGARWTTVIDRRVNDVDGASASDVWVASETGPMHFDGHAFVAVPFPSELVPPGTSGDPHAGEVTRIHALGGGRALAITNEVLLSFDGAWTRVLAQRASWSLESVAGSGPNDVWLARRHDGRSNDAAIDHFDGATWSEALVPGVSSFGELATTGRDTWLATDGALVHLTPSGVVSSEPVVTNDWRVFGGASLWVGPRALWLTTTRQARRFSL